MEMPTIYENPVAYSIMTGIAADIEKSAERIFGWKYENRPTMGTLPLGQVNASAIHVPFTDQYIIVFQENLFVFVSLCAKVVAAAIPSDGTVEPAQFFYALPGIDAQIAANPTIAERFNDVLIAYLLTGRPHANGQYVLVGDSDEADRHSELIAITVPGWIRSVVGAKRRWRMDFAESDRDRQACCC
jgi:hypothetical protein